MWLQATRSRRGCVETGCIKDKAKKGLYRDTRTSHYQFCICGFAYHFAANGLGQFYLFTIPNARLNELQLSMISLFAGLGQFCLFRYGAGSDREKGKQHDIIIGAAGMAATPLAFTTLIRLPDILVVNFFFRDFSCGIQPFFCFEFS